MALMEAGLLALAQAAGAEVASAAEEASSPLDSVAVTAGGRAEFAQTTPISLATHDRAQSAPQLLRAPDAKTSPLRSVRG